MPPSRQALRSSRFFFTRRLWRTRSGLWSAPSGSALVKPASSRSGESTPTVSGNLLKLKGSRSSEVAPSSLGGLAGSLAGWEQDVIQRGSSPVAVGRRRACAQRGRRSVGGRPRGQHSADTAEAACRCRAGREVACRLRDLPCIGIHQPVHGTLLDHEPRLQACAFAANARRDASSCASRLARA